MCPKHLQKQLKIVIISDWFTEEMGYGENMLPKAMANFGHEVHLITSNGKTYFTDPMYNEVYAPFFGPPIVDCYVRKVDGVTVHRLPHCIKQGDIWILGLYETLESIHPDIVQVFEVTPLTTLYSGLWSHRLGYRLFSESRMHASIFDGTNIAIAQSWSKITFRMSSFIQRRFNSVRQQYDRYGFKHTAGQLLRIPVDLAISPLERMILSRLTIRRTVKCYPLSQDILEILVNFFNWPVEKLEICPLGVDTHLFTPPRTDKHVRERYALRERLGFSDQDIVCIYTGRFTEGKDPLCLALAIDELVKKGLPFRGLFVGNGDDEYLERLRKCHGCMIHPFVSVAELPAFYRAADIGVWPKQESTSQLDAMSCGLPLVLSDRVKAVERIDGNAATFVEGDFHSLALAIKSLLPVEKRKCMGKIGAERVRNQLGWNSIATARIEDYKQSVLDQSA